VAERPSLDDALDRLRWAKHHFEILGGEIEAFQERDSHTISFVRNVDTGEYVFYIHGLEVADPDWGLMVSDCIHNARVALDYLMVRLWALVIGQDAREIGGVAFPICARRESDTMETDEDIIKALSPDRARVGVM